MPRFDGFEVLRALRAEQASCEMPVLVLTADSRRTTTIDCFELGADEVITKPFMPEALTESIARLLTTALEDRLAGVGGGGGHGRRTAFG